MHNKYACDLVQTNKAAYQTESGIWKVIKFNAIINKCKYYIHDLLVALHA